MRLQVQSRRLPRYDAGNLLLQTLLLGLPSEVLARPLRLALRVEAPAIVRHAFALQRLLHRDILRQRRGEVSLPMRLLRNPLSDLAPGMRAALDKVIGLGPEDLRVRVLGLVLCRVDKRDEEV